MPTAENKLIVFSLPGLGQHHLANIIATCDRYYYPVDYKKYFVPGPANAHYQWKGPHIRAQRGILTYHYGTEDYQEIKDTCRHHDTKFIVITLPKTNQLAWDRMLHTNIDVVDTDDCISYHTKIYDPEYLSKKYPGQWYTVMSDDLFSENINSLIQSLELILELKFHQHEFLTHIHQTWLAKIRQNPNPYEM